ncbi:hypothetical protein [Aliamphritea spongicola]|nr:hypothetical protein [Aliamphritea spongicola]
MPGESTSESDKLTEKEINRLIAISSMKSLSDRDQDKTDAYSIISDLLNIIDDEKVLGAADVILSRLGNFPGRALLRNRFGESNKVPSFLKLETLSREIENSVFDDDRKIQLTDFQYKFYTSLKRKISQCFCTYIGRKVVHTRHGFDR